MNGVARFPWVLAVAVTALVAAPARSQQTHCNATAIEPFSGAYRATDGAMISVLPADEGGRLRITHFESGRSHLLFPVAARTFRSADDLDSEHPVAFRYIFGQGADGIARSLEIKGAGSRRVTARRVALVDRPAAFTSGGIELRGRLTMPASLRRPARAVVFVHGSDPVASAGREWLPHLLASAGVATLVFDKRGTGCSQGEYVQHFDVLAEDVVAAVRWLALQPGIDPRRIGLVGFSQGGWVAPLAALKEPSIRFVAVAYGLAMSMADEDRLEAPLKLKEQGVDDASIEEFKALNAALHDLARTGFRDWAPFEHALERSRGRPWFPVATRQQSWLGVTMQMGVEQAKAVAPRMFQDFFQPFYDPVPTLERLNIPMLWLVAGKDMEAPPEPTLEVLARLKRQGRILTVKTFPDADHGIQDFEVRNGRRVRTRFSDGYFSTLRGWVLQAR